MPGHMNDVKMAVTKINNITIIAIIVANTNLITIIIGFISLPTDDLIIVLKCRIRSYNAFYQID